MASGKRSVEQAPKHAAPSNPSSPSALLSDIPLLLLIRIGQILVTVTLSQCIATINLIYMPTSRINDAGNGRIFMGLSSDTAQMFHVKHLCLDETGIVTLCDKLGNRPCGEGRRDESADVVQGASRTPSPSSLLARQRRADARAEHRTGRISRASRIAAAQVSSSTSKGSRPRGYSARPARIPYARVRLF